MTSPDNQDQPQTEQKLSDKELNFRALEQKYQRQLEMERMARQEAERQVQELALKKQEPQEDEDDSEEPYVDHKRLNKKLSKFSQSTKSEIEKAMEFAKQKAKEEIKSEMWLEKHPDFYDVVNKYGDKLKEADPDLAESILDVPDVPTRMKLAYKNIKALGLDKPQQKQSTIQEKVDSNRRSPYYQPTGVGSAPYSSAGDFSPSGQKNAYAKMQELKNKLRL